MVLFPLAGISYGSSSNDEVFSDLPQFELPNVQPDIDGNIPWISATSFFRDWALDLILDKRADREPLSRERMEELGRIDSDGKKKSVAVGGIETFWTMDMTSNQPIQVDCVLRKIGKHCYVYVEEGAENMPDRVVDKLCREFDNNIYPVDTTYFGQEWKPGVDWDPRTTLIFLDIKDGWEPGKGYVGGYFFPLNEYSQRIFEYSNEREMIYCDIYPSNPESEDYLGVVAHEFQHLIHWYRHEKETRWLNEACSQLAFLVCGYGHAPQTFQFIRNSDTGMEEFDNGIDDYGCVYQFFYWLHEKYAGDTIEEKKVFFRDLCDNQNESLQSVRETLIKHGIEKPLDDIFIEWCIANTANLSNPSNNLYKYDDTFKSVVEPAARYALGALPADKVETDVQPYAADYISIVPSIRWAPHCPVMGDKVSLLGTGPGKVRWNINEGVLPPEKLIGDDSVVAGEYVETPLFQDVDGKWKAIVGPFYKLGLAVEQLNVVFVEEGAERVYTVPVFSIDTLAGAKYDLVSGYEGFKFIFDGKKKKNFILYKIIKRENSCSIEQVELDEDNNCTVEIPAYESSIKEITFMVAALDGKKFKYEYSVEGVKSETDILNDEALSGSASQNLINRKFGQALLLRNIEAKYLELQIDDDKLVVARNGAQQAERELAELIIKSEENLAQFTAIMTERANGEGSNSQKLLEKAVSQSIFRQAKYNLMKTGNGHVSHTDLATGTKSHSSLAAKSTGQSVVKSASPSVVKSDVVDDSHDNLGYLTWKKMELVHSLTHLKIDPNFVEGQLIQIWTTLQIAQGFPNLPIPDGLNIADFKEDGAVAVLRQWSDDFDIGYEFPEEFAVPAEDSERSVLYTKDIGKVKRVIKRLILSEAIVEYCYNSSLSMADDMAMCLYDFVKLILTTKSAIDNIAANFENLPIVGPVATKLKQIIHGKLVRIVQNIGSILSAKLPSPYNSIAPTVLQVIVWAYGKFLKVDVPGSDNNMLIETGAKLIAKYALTAIPKIGYIDRGQQAVDKGVVEASKLTDQGTLVDAQVMVWDDGNADTMNSIREQVAEKLNKTHGIVARNRKIADVGKKILEIAQYTSLLDPTAISKVLGITAGVASTGLLAQGSYLSGRLFSKLPRKYATKGSLGAFGVTMPDDETDEDKDLLSLDIDVAGATKLLRALRNSEKSLNVLAERAYRASVLADRTVFAEAFDALANEDSNFDKVTVKLESIIYASSDISKGDGMALELYTGSQASHFERIDNITRAFANYNNRDAGYLFNAASSRNTVKYVDFLEKQVTDILTKKSSRAVLLVSEVVVNKTSENIVINATVCNLSASDINDVKISLTTAMRLELAANVEKVLTTVPAGIETFVQFVIPVQNINTVEMPIFAVELEAKGVKPITAFSGF